MSVVVPLQIQHEHSTGKNLCLLLLKKSKSHWISKFDPETKSSHCLLKIVDMENKDKDWWSDEFVASYDAALQNHDRYSELSRYNDRTELLSERNRSWERRNLPINVLLRISLPSVLGRPRFFNAQVSKHPNINYRTLYQTEILDSTSKKLSLNFELKLRYGEKYLKLEFSGLQPDQVDGLVHRIGMIELFHIQGVEHNKAADEDISISTGTHDIEDKHEHGSVTTSFTSMYQTVLSEFSENTTLQVKGNEYSVIRDKIPNGKIPQIPTEAQQGKSMKSIMSKKRSDPQKSYPNHISNHHPRHRKDNDTETILSPSIPPHPHLSPILPEKQKEMKKNNEINHILDAKSFHFQDIDAHSYTDQSIGVNSTLEIDIEEIPPYQELTLEELGLASLYSKKSETQKKQSDIRSQTNLQKNMPTKNDSHNRKQELSSKHLQKAHTNGNNNTSLDQEVRSNETPRKVPQSSNSSKDYLSYLDEVIETMKHETKEDLKKIQKLTELIDAHRRNISPYRHSPKHNQEEITSPPNSGQQSRYSLSYTGESIHSLPFSSIEENEVVDDGPEDVDPEIVESDCDETSTRITRISNSFKNYKLQSPPTSDNVRKERSKPSTIPTLALRNYNDPFPQQQNHKAVYSSYYRSPPRSLASPRRYTGGQYHWRNKIAPDPQRHKSNSYSNIHSTKSRTNKKTEYC